MTDMPNGAAPMLLDVDTGIDDALAIALAVASGANLVGISTVAGNVPAGMATNNTRRVLSWLGAGGIPVHRGASRPLAVAHQDAAHVHGENGLGGADLGESMAPESETNGVQALLEAGDRYDGELVLVATGPLTNVAIALSLRPALVRQIRRLVLMGGAYFVGGNVTPHAEFNIRADPEAAAQVLAAEWTAVIAVGLDATEQTALTRDQWQRISGQASPAAEMARRMAARTFRERRMEGFYLHDPLAVAVALDPVLVDCESRTVSVVTAGEQRGRTMPEGDGNVRVARSVDAGRFEALFATRLGIPERRQAIHRERSE